jgi:hypothetical protein
MIFLDLNPALHTWSLAHSSTQRLTLAEKRGTRLPLLDNNLYRCLCHSHADSDEELGGEMPQTSKSAD